MIAEIVDLTAHRERAQKQRRTAEQAGDFTACMKLVGDTAAYLDGKGRADQKALQEYLQKAYAFEAARLTTCLLDIASFYLIQRAYVSREVTDEEARGKLSKLRWKGYLPPTFDWIPAELSTLAKKTTILYAKACAHCADLEQLLQSSGQGP